MAENKLLGHISSFARFGCITHLGFHEKHLRRLASGENGPKLPIVFPFERWQPFSQSTKSTCIQLNDKIWLAEDMKMKLSMNDSRM
jgi:hypothetical protein